jgi:hypothetical protein
MPKYGSYLQRDAYRLFKKQDIDMEKWEKCKFEIALDDKNDKYIMGEKNVKKMEEIKKTLDDMVEECENIMEEYGEIYMIFDMDGYEIRDYDNDEYRNWIYDYEIDEYYDLIVGKLDEYYILVKAIEDEKEKIQLEKDVCVGVALALMR